MIEVHHFDSSPQKINGISQRRKEDFLTIHIITFKGESNEKLERN
jgi:hypothetical protein